MLYSGVFHSGGFQNLHRNVPRNGVLWNGPEYCSPEWQYFTLPLLVQRTPTDFRRTLPFPTDSADSPSEVHRSPLDMTEFRC